MISFLLLDSLAQVEDPYIIIPTPMLETYKAVKSRGISVTLDGHGADELLVVMEKLCMLCVQLRLFPEFNEIIEIDRSSRSGIFSSRASFYSAEIKATTLLFIKLLGLLPRTIKSNF